MSPKINKFEEKLKQDGESGERGREGGREGGRERERSRDWMVSEFKVILICVDSSKLG